MTSVLDCFAPFWSYRKVLLIVLWIDSYQVTLKNCLPILSYSIRSALVNLASKSLSFKFFQFSIYFNCCLIVVVMLWISNYIAFFIKNVELFLKRLSLFKWVCDYWRVRKNKHRVNFSNICFLLKPPIHWIIPAFQVS